MNPPKAGGGGDVSDDVAEARETVIEAMERSADIYGLNRSYGRLYGILFFADEPMSLDELVEKSGYAKSTVSTAMKDMAKLHLVHRRSQRGEGKRAFYEAERDFWTIVQEFLRGEVKREIAVMTRALEEAERTLEAAEDEQARSDLEKIRQLLAVYDRSQKLVNLLLSSSIDRLTGLIDRLRGD
ncbi:MAG: GbsR/MarR family transcriptional regulator [Halodesulfurarchaeum sp.]